MQALADLVSGELRSGSREPVIITDVSHDSRRTGPGCLYVAIVGAHFDGHDFVDQAVALGSPAVCVTHSVDARVPQILVKDTRMSLGPLSAGVHDDPSAAMKVIGITGTNGKTTVAHYLSSIGLSGGVSTGVIGTIQTKLDGEAIEAVRTTPEASDFQRLLSRMREKGADMVAVEVSSHGLALGRVRATHFAVAAFTNLSQDHLDFHGDMASYFGAKKSLFEDYDVGTAVINVDDPAGEEIAASFSGELIRVGRSGDVRVLERETLDGKTRFELATPWGPLRAEAPIAGAFNVDNAAIAAASAMVVGIDPGQVEAGLNSLDVVPGRFEVVSGNDPILVIVDYAHTPDGIEKVIAAARGLGRERVVALVGAGGDRDRGKRPLMGEAVSAADLAVVTTDNPRSERPADIGEAVVAGVRSGTPLIYELDRAQAIQAAIDSATDEDVVLILGRGHEPYQEVDGRRTPFDDRLVARQALDAHRKSADSGAGSGSID